MASSPKWEKIVARKRRGESGDGAAGYRHQGYTLFACPAPRSLPAISFKSFFPELFVCPGQQRFHPLPYLFLFHFAEGAVVVRFRRSPHLHRNHAKRRRFCVVVACLSTNWLMRFSSIHEFLHPRNSQVKKEKGVCLINEILQNRKIHTCIPFEILKDTCWKLEGKG